SALSGLQPRMRLFVAWASAATPGAVPFTNAQHLRFRKAISVRARRQTRESTGEYIQYVTGVSERSQRGYGVN
ncbi:hypothetical protein OFM41_32930, partial [Escherichia coli]|nr:hypothetical protein [Escherichia coli]